MAKTTPFKGTKFRIGVGREGQKAITAIALATNEITVASSGYQKGDAIEITGAGSLDGVYPVLSVSGDKVKFCEEVNWVGNRLFDPNNVDDLNAIAELDSQVFLDFSKATEAPKDSASEESSN